MPKIIRRERLKYRAPCPLLFIPSTKYPHTCTSRSWLYDLFILLGPIFFFAKYLRQVCFSFSTYHELHKSLLEVRERRRTKALVRVQTLWANESIIRGTCFYFKNLLKPSGCNLGKGIDKWCFMNHSISEPPKTRRKPKAPRRLR